MEEIDMSTYSPRGSLWNRWDLHFHTPSSFDYENKSVTNKDIVEILVKNNVRVVAITDHHNIDIARIRELQALGKDRITVLPGIELRSDQGGEPIHYICIFPEDCDLNHVWTTLQGNLGLTPVAIATKGGDQCVYVPLEKGGEVTRKLGGVVSIHAGAKSNSIECIKNKEQFQHRIKYDITNDWVDLMEIGQIKDVDVHLNTIFPATGLNKPLILCSDSHQANNYSTKAPLWLRADPTFRGLLMVLREPRGRVFIGERPEEQIRVAQNPTKYIRGISFSRKETAPAAEHWFGNTITFNPGLVAIVGNKGSGKAPFRIRLVYSVLVRTQKLFRFLAKRDFVTQLQGMQRISRQFSSGNLVRK